MFDILASVLLTNDVVSFEQPGSFSLKSGNFYNQQKSLSKIFTVNIYKIILPCYAPCLSLIRFS